MDWLWVAGLLLIGLIVFGVVLGMRIRRDRAAGTEGADVWEDEGAKRRRDDPGLRDWGHGSGPY